MSERELVESVPGMRRNFRHGYGSLVHAGLVRDASRGWTEAGYVEIAAFCGRVNPVLRHARYPREGDFEEVTCERCLSKLRRALNGTPERG